MSASQKSGRRANSSVPGLPESSALGGREGEVREQEARGFTGEVALGRSAFGEKCLWGEVALGRSGFGEKWLGGEVAWGGSGFGEKPLVCPLAI